MLSLFTAYVANYFGRFCVFLALGFGKVLSIITLRFLLFPNTLTEGPTRQADSHTNSISDRKSTRLSSYFFCVFLAFGLGNFLSKIFLLFLLSPNPFTGGPRKKADSHTNSI